MMNGIGISIQATDIGRTKRPKEYQLLFARSGNPEKRSWLKTWLMNSIRSPVPKKGKLAQQAYGDESAPAVHENQDCCA